MTVYDYYKLLGVGREATAEQVRAAFQRQAAKCHPSQRPDDEAAARRYRLLEAAYQVLSDPDQRAKYDRLIDRRAAGLDSPAKRPKAAKEASSKATPKARRVRPADKPSRQRVVIRPAPEEAARHKRFHRRRSKAERYALQALKHILWWSVSAAIHVAVLLILANWYLQEQSQEELFGKLPIVDIVPPKAKPEPLDLSTQKSPEPPTLEPTFEEPDLDEIIDKDAFAEVQRQAKAKVAAVEGPFGRRTPQGRARALEGGGATAGSEAAVNAGLLWLATHQQRTGGWQADREASYWVNPGITGLATLAFLGAGHTHRPGRYQEIVRRALAYLKRKQDTEGCIAYRQDGKRAGGYMYNHAIGTLALVEAYAMTKDATLREPAERAVDFISRTQNSTGGWRYYAHSPDADSSVSGWMVMALRSARLAGIIVPDKTFDGARKFFDSVTDREKGVTFYRVNGGRQIVSVASFAIGLLAHEYLYEEPDRDYIARAGAMINKNPPKWIPLNPKSTSDRMDLENLSKRQFGANDYYYWYYANLALHQRRGDAWESWHPKVRDTLIKVQVAEGDDRGSWPPASRWSIRGGRVYATAMAILTLEVYYRYAPIYREVVDETLAAFGAALDAYNDFVRVANEPEKAEPAAKATIAKLEDFLTRSQPQEGEPLDEATRARRRKAMEMLISIYRVRKNFQRAIDYLEALPRHFPDQADSVTRRRLLAQCHLLLAHHLADQGKTEEAEASEAAALDLLEGLLIEGKPGENPKLELWVAGQLFKRQRWEAAMEIYREHADRLEREPKANEHAAFIYRRIVQCSKNLERYKTASFYLRRLRGVLGPSLEILREEADLERLRGRPTAARRIYESILPRLAKLSPEWWQTEYELLEAALQEGRHRFVAKEIEKLRVLHPSLGSPRTRARLLQLRRRAQAATRG